MQIMNSRRVSRRFVTVRRLVIAVVILGGIGMWVGYRPLANRYRLWKQGRALAQARQFLEQKDLPSAKLALDVAVATAPGNPEVMRLAADLLEMAGSPEALVLRRRVVALAPEAVADRLAMAAAALRLRDFNAVRDALAGIKPADLEQPDVLRAHLRYALAVNNRPLADALFDRLAAIATPDDDLKALHALLLRQHPDPQKSAAARKDLETLAANPKLSLAIQRAFYTEAIATRDFPAAKRHAAMVTADPAATLTDHLHEANLRLVVDKQPFDAVFARLAPLGAASGPAAAELARWMLVQGKATEVERWLGGLPATVAGTPEVAGVRAELAAAARDWDQFGRLLEAGAWGPIPAEIVRLAMSAQVVGTRNPSLRKQVWEEAMGAAGTNMNALRVLLRMVNTWQWEDELESLLWKILRVDPSQSWAHGTLMSVFQQRGDGRKMLEVVTILKDSAPSSATYRHDWALLTMLVHPTKTWDAPKIMAKDVHAADPQNPNYATSHALALAQAGKAAEALAIIEKLPPAERDYAPRAPYLAFVYGRNRRRTEFEKYAALAASARVLAQERALVPLGQEALDRPVMPPPEPKKAPAPKTPPAK